MSIVEEDTGKLPPNVKRKVLLTSLASITFCNMMINNVVAIIPDFLLEKQNWNADSDYKLNEKDASLIISIFSISQIIFAPFNGHIKAKLGAKNTMIFGYTVLTITTIALGAIEGIKDPKTWMTTACFCRFF